VRDVEALCVSIVQRSSLELSHHEREDLTTYLIETCWSLSLRFEPGGITFSTWAGNTLKLRLVDWQRSRKGRTKWAFANGSSYVRTRPEYVSFDADDSLRDRVEAAQSERKGDPEDDRDPDLGGLLADRDSSRARDLSEMGLEPAE
jgi:hypothetical protein